MRTTLILALSVACSGSPKTPTTPAVPAATENPVAKSVVAAMNPDVRACDDFYEYACGGWFKSTELPADRSIMTRSFTTIFDQNEAVIHTLLEAAAKDPGDDPVKQKLGKYYGTCMDTAAVEAAGMAPLKPYFDEIAAAKTKDDLLEVAGRFMSFGPNPFFTAGPWADPKNPTMNIAHIEQAGLGLPDRSYYIDPTPERQVILDAYKVTIVDMMMLAGLDEREAGVASREIVEFERKLAEGQWERAALRDADKTYNLMTIDELEALAPKVDLKRWFEGAGITTDHAVNVTTPSYFTHLGKVLAGTKEATLRKYLQWHILTWAAPNLTPELDARHFAFFGTTVSGTKEQRPQWKRCVERTDKAMGEWLGKAYVQERFQGDSKAVAEEMVAGIFASFETNLPNLAWMDDTTRGRAIEKANAFVSKLGYPKTWRDYTALEVGASALDNEVASASFNGAYAFAKVGTKVDPDEWHMTPQQVNAYYNPTGNEIVFPAGIMQPPFFDRTFPRAMNFGGLGMVIGHELTHGFDDEGRKYDATGQLSEWWEPAVSERFEEEAQCVVDQYAGWEVAGVKLDGNLTLGENIADLGGLKFAHLAYMDWVAKNGEEPTMAGLTGEQQLFVAFAQGWCTIATDEVARVRAATDPHSPPRYRINGPAMNLPAFSKAFGCTEGTDAMAPTDRCEVW